MNAEKQVETTLVAPRKSLGIQSQEDKKQVGGEPSACCPVSEQATCCSAAEKGSCCEKPGASSCGCK